MTQTKSTPFAEIIELEGFNLLDAGIGKRFTTYPNGATVNHKKARFVLTTKKRYYAGETIDCVLISAFRDGNVDLHKYGWDTCHRCNGAGKLSHYSHIHSGDCFTCKGFGVI